MAYAIYYSSLAHLLVFADEAAEVLRAIIGSGGLNAVELCTAAAESSAGLRRDFSQADALLSPGEALLW
jgi:hypothetical protein